MTDTSTPKPTKRGPGRPPGARTNPAKKAAASSRKAASKPTGPTAQPAPSPEVDAPPVGPQTLADLFAQAAVPETEKGPGRPKAVDKSADVLALIYQAFGALIEIPSRFIPGLYRFGAVGAALQEHSETCGTALARWADGSPNIKRKIEGGGQLANLLLVVAAHGPIMLAPVFAQPPGVNGGIATDAGEAPDSTTPGPPPAAAGDPMSFLSPLLSSFFGEPAADIDAPAD